MPSQKTKRHRHSAAGRTSTLNYQECLYTPQGQFTVMADERYRGLTAEIYFASPQQKKKYYDMARERGCKFSKLMLSILEEVSQPRTEIPQAAEELEALREENRQLHKTNKELIQERDRQDQEVRRLRNESFLQPSVDNFIDPDLLVALQSGPLHSRQLLERLDINPTDGQAIRAITRQLEILESLGFITRGPRGWKWLK